MNTLRIDDCRLFNARADSPANSVLIENGVITQIGSLDTRPYAAESLDAGGRVLAPGLIDVHIQGAGGADVLDGTDHAIEVIAKTCASFGTTGFLATTVFRPGQDNRHLAIAARNVQRPLGGATLLGIHLEGPFIATEKRGAIHADCICPPDAKVLDSINDLAEANLTMMTLAPELSGALGMVDALVQQRTIPALGHTSATWDQTKEGFDAGIRHVTHLFNAMPSLHHRDPGPLPAILCDERVTAQLIADGVHLHPAVLKLAYDVLGEQRAICITDGMRAMGLPDGKYTYNGTDYEASNGRVRSDDGTLIGTALDLTSLLKRLTEFTGCSLQSAIQTASMNPAKLLGLGHRKGSIDVGKDADLLLLNTDLSVHATIVEGDVVYRADVTD